MTVVLVGCGRMGGALARGWAGSENVAVFDPMAPAMEGVRRLATIDEAQALPGPLSVIIAVKPQVLGDVLPGLRPLADAGALIISIAAGATLATMARTLGTNARLVRAMPNTPAAVGRGITAAVAAPTVEPEGCDRVTALLGAVGEVVWLEDEGQMDAVTAVSGSGPAYFFRFAEALARAGEEQGLSPELATKLARATFIGAGALAESRHEELATLRQEVTSPGGTTAAALARFDRDGTFEAIVGEAVDAAATRSRELAL